ncbi:MAG TPA: hypothetical protein VFT34_17790 [Verrucomicrobiae bacterium]|nr:hypothetical protein [Verrucomicrobiae bacterium]
MAVPEPLSPADASNGRLPLSFGLGGCARMSQFVNYTKRSFKLPPGCKDLIDILEPSRRRTKADLPSGCVEIPQIKQDHFHTSGLAQIGRYVSMLLDSSAEVFMLMVTYRDDQNPMLLYRSKSECTVAIALLATNRDREQAIRAFFDERGIQPLQDYPFSDAGTPDAARDLIYRLPFDASHTTSLTTDLLRVVYGLSDVAGLDFTYYEMGRAA